MPKEEIVFDIIIDLEMVQRLLVLVGFVALIALVVMLATACIKESGRVKEVDITKRGIMLRFFQKADVATKPENETEKKKPPSTVSGSTREFFENPEDADWHR